MQPGLSPNEASALFDWTLVVARAGEESGLPMVFRKDMPLNLVTDKHGRQVPIWGGSKSSSKTTGHAETIDRKAHELASTGDYANIFVGDRSWRTATGRVANSRRRPDIIAVDKDGKIHAYEIQSGTDSLTTLELRLNEVLDSIPKKHRGQGRAIPPDNPRP